MPIANVQDAREVERSLQDVLTAPNVDGRAQALRSLFIETLDFDYVDRLVPLGAANDPNLPADARLLAHRDGFSILYIPLDGTDDNHVKTATASAAAKVIGDTILPDEPLLQFTNRDCDQLHLIYPDLSGSRPRLQRLVAHRGQPARTVVQQIANLWHDYGESDKTMDEAIQNAFSVQPVTEAFFKDYKTAYDAAVSLIATSIDQSEAEQFTQTLFNRLLFVHFVSRKGWLRFNGDANYLNALWRDYHKDVTVSNFYTDRITTVFFAGLNNPQSQDLSDGVRNLIGQVPFLNGGLFEETELDARAAKGGLTVSDKVIAPLLGDGNEPGLFNRYNFTVTEATPLDTEVAVDPEMLGKLFEETVNERNSNGAFYTPRSVVTFMCREAIKGYLAGRDIDGLNNTKIGELVDNANPHAVTVAQALEVANAVADLKAVDPACGSGAFLLGMLQEIIALNETLFRAGHTPESLYQQKLNIISNNIYGVDNDGLAVSTAMLRLWLSLAVDYDGDGPPEPLPNLDLKLVVGDAVAGPNPQHQELNDAIAGPNPQHQELNNAIAGSNPQHQQLDVTLAGIVHSSLQQDISDYTTAQGQCKVALREKVDLTKAQLRAGLQSVAPTGAVEWRIDFADVILKGGFDVVIANPPYVQLQKQQGKLSNLYKNVGYTTFIGTGDIYQLFYERGCQLLKLNHGLLAYITSNSWLKAEYGKKTRRYLAEQHTPVTLIEMGKDVFDEAIVDTNILLLRQGLSKNHGKLTIQAVDIDHLDESNFPSLTEQWGLVRPNGDGPWSILSRIEQSIMDKILAVGTPLRDWDIAINYGIKTGFNDAFIIDNQTKDALVADDPRSAEIIKPVLRGRDIQRYRAKWAKIWLIDTHNGYDGVPAINIDDYPAIKVHLDGHYEQLEKRYDKGRTPYNLRNCAYHTEFVKEKLFWIDLTEEGRFAYDIGEMFCVNSAYMMTGASLKFLCAVLNSALTTWFMRNSALNSGMGTTRWVRSTVDRIPIPIVDAMTEQPFIQIMDEILYPRYEKADATKLKADLDDLVYSLYRLTEDEVRVIISN